MSALEGAAAVAGIVSAVVDLVTASGAFSDFDHARSLRKRFLPERLPDFTPPKKKNSCYRFFILNGACVLSPVTT